MTPKTIQNACNILLGDKAGMVPNMQGALQNYYQPMTFSLVTKTMNVGKITETMTEISFRGVLNPYKPSEMQIKMQGERVWTWWQLHCEPELKLNVDDVVIYKNVQYRVMSFMDYRLYNFMKYVLVQDYTNAGPTVTE